MTTERYTFTDMVPRYVPMGVKMRVRFGGFIAQFGWFFLGFGLIFFWAFGVDHVIAHLLTWHGKTAAAPGVVRACEETNLSENETKVYRHRYEFTVDGAQQEGVCYATGRQLAPGTAVTVEYLASNPSRSRIEGMRPTMMSPWGIFVVIFPLVGLVFVTVSLMLSRKRLRLLRDGKTGFGKLIDRKATRTQINDQTVYKYTFEFATADGNTYKATARTHLSGLFDEENEPLLYDPENPNYAVMLDEVPGSPRIDKAGDIHTDKPLVSVMVVIVPFATLIAHGTVIVMRYF